MKIYEGIFMNLAKIEPKNEGKRISFDELRKQADKKVESTAVFINENLGHATLVTTFTIKQFLLISDVLNTATIMNDARFKGMSDAQRELDPKHAHGLSKYILKGLLMSCYKKFKNNEEACKVIDALEMQLNRSPYVALQPFTCHIREPMEWDEKYQEGVPRVYITPKHRLLVMDGQHRRYALIEVMKFLEHVRQKRNYFYKEKGNDNFFQPLDDEDHISQVEVEVWEKINELTQVDTTIAVEIHRELTTEQERQLFYDLNNRMKKVEQGLAFKYDRENPINLWIKDELETRNILRPKVVDKDQKDWSKDPGEMARKDLIAINAILFLNKTSIKTAKTKDIENKKEVAIRFWSVINSLKFFGEKGAKTKTILAQSVVLKAIAKLVYAFAFNKKTKDEKALADLFRKIKTINFSHSNKLWNYYNLSQKEKKEFDGLDSYLPLISGGNRDMGKVESGYMRFNIRHNDVAPLIGDMIRFELNLPKRKHKAIKKS
jgi:hypothetical protein